MGDDYFFILDDKCLFMKIYKFALALQSHSNTSVINHKLITL
jgi:hypothetical protein